MKQVQVVLVIAVIISAGAAGYFALHRFGNAHPVSMPASRSKLSSDNSGDPFRRQNATAKRPAKTPVALQSYHDGYRMAFSQATSYYDFVRNTIPAAKAGNPEAEFYVSEALGFCKQGYEQYFFKTSPDAPPPSLEDVIGRFTAHLSNLIEVVRNVYNKCHILMENDVAQWGTREDWLAKATDAGIPAAQARAADSLLAAEVLHEPPPIKSAEQDPRALLRSALETKDPAALFVAGMALSALDELNNPRLNDAHVQGERNKNKLAWWLLACNRGYDCSENAPWFGAICASDPHCQTGQTTAVEYIHQTAQDLRYTNLEQRAEELDAKLDAGAWGDLGLGG